MSKLAAYFRSDWLRAFLIVLVGVLVHAPALQGELIWDDQYLAHDNPLIKSPLLIAEIFRHHLFLDSLSAHYRPVQNLSFIADYFFWNSNTYGFHLTNVVLHVSSAVLLYFLLRQVFTSVLLRRASFAVRAGALQRLPWISLTAFFVALIWVVHPVHSAAVDYISGRADSLAFLFASAGWLLFLRAQPEPRLVFRVTLYLLAAIAGLLSLLSREIGGIWIALFLAHLVLVERQKRISLRSRIGTVMSCAVLFAMYFALRHLPEQRLTSVGEPEWSAPTRAVLMARALGDYGRLLIFPRTLHMERTVFDSTAVASNGDWRKTVGLEYLSIAGLTFFALLAGASAKRGRGQPARIFGAAWFLAGYLPISNLLPLNATVAEHWLYLPSVGFLIFVAGCVFELPARYRQALVMCAIAAVAALGARSVVRSSDWVKEIKFYERTLAAGGTSARITANLARLYAQRGDYPAAEKMLRRVAKIAPDYPIGLNNLANVLFREGKTAEAEAIFGHSAKIAAENRRYPRPWIAAVNFAQLRHRAGDDVTALATLESTRVAYPNVWEVISYESEILRQTKGPDAALPLLKDFAAANWWHFGAALALGRLHAQKGDVDLANNALRHASRLDIHDAQALSLMATISMEHNRLDDACRMQRWAIARQPDEPRQYILLSNILEKMGREDEARAALAHVSQLRDLAKSDSTLLN